MSFLKAFTEEVRILLSDNSSSTGFHYARIILNLRANARTGFSGISLERVLSSKGETPNRVTIENASSQIQVPIASGKSIDYANSKYNDFELLLCAPVHFVSDANAAVTCFRLIYRHYLNNVLRKYNEHEKMERSLCHL